MGQSLEQKRKTEKRIKEVKRMTDAGETIDTIAKAVGASRRTVIRDREYLREINMLSDKEDMLEKVKRATEKGKSKAIISKELGISTATVTRYRKELREQNRLTGNEKPNTELMIDMNKKKNMEKNMKKVKKIMSDGKKTIAQIAEEVGLSKTTIVAYKKIFKEQELEQLNEKVQKLYENFYGQTDTIEKFEEYLTLCKERYEQKMIDEKDLIAIKCAAISTQRYENIAFYLKLCIRFNQFEEAIKFAHDYVNCETFTQEEKEKIKKSKEECQRYFKAINMIKQKNKEEQTKGVSRVSDEQIMEISGVSKVELAILKKKAGQQVEEDKKTIRSQEENDGGEDLSL